MAALGVETAPLFGRFNAGVIKMEPMRYDDVSAFYKGCANYGITEKLIMYGALGGTPRYHAMVDTVRPWTDQIVDLLMRPGSPLEAESRFLLSSEQIRDPAPYNAILGAIAHGRTQYGQILNATGIGGTVLASFLKGLIELGGSSRRDPMAKLTNRRSIYLLADPFLTFWYRFVAPTRERPPVRRSSDRIRGTSSALSRRLHGLERLRESVRRLAPKNAKPRLGLSILELGRYWSRDSSNEIDIVADLDDGSRLFAECKWSARSLVGMDDYNSLRSKVARLPKLRWAEGASYALFSVGGFTEELRRFALADRLLHLVDGAMLYTKNGS